MQEGQGGATLHTSQRDWPYCAPPAVLLTESADVAAHAISNVSMKSLFWGIGRFGNH